jgi:chromosome segregation ATPase
MNKAQDKRAMLAAQEKFMASFTDTEECTRSALRGFVAGWKAARLEDAERDHLRAELAKSQALASSQAENVRNATRLVDETRSTVAQVQGWIDDLRAALAAREAEVVELKAEIATLREGLSTTVRAVLDIPDAEDN